MHLVASSQSVFFTLLEHYGVIVYNAKKPVLDIKNPTPTN